MGASRDFLRSAGSTLSKSPGAQQQEIKGGYERLEDFKPASIFRIQANIRQERRGIEGKGG